MSIQGWAQIVVFLVVLTALTPLVGGYMARVYSGERVLIGTVIGPIERLLYRCFFVDARKDQTWKQYSRSLIIFSIFSWGAVYLILRLQKVHPFNPEGFHAPPWNLVFNTASSFLTNTNWQFYSGETTMTYFSQMAALTVQNFLSPAVGIAAAIAVIRGFARSSSATIGNFYYDVTRTVLYVLIPISIAVAIFLLSQGVIQNLSHYETFTTINGTQQTLALGPVASQEAIKELGTNGGGFFNANSSAPFENPTGLSNFVEMIMILLIGAALTATFGRMVGSRRQGWVLYTTMMTVFIVSIALAYIGESHASPAQHLAGISGPNMEGKEVRFGTTNSVLFNIAATVTSCGAINSAMESFTGLGASMPLLNMMTGEVIFGGVGTGLTGMFLFVLVAVFIAGLMVGRTPEYLGKKIQAREIKLVSIGVLFVPLFALFAAGLAIATKVGKKSLSTTGPQGFAENLYAYVSQANNNGSAFAGYTGFIQPNAGNVGAHGLTFVDLLGSFAMLFGRFIPILAVLAVAGFLAEKRSVPASVGTFRTDTPIFVVLLIATIVLVALLTYVPALLLGPVVQALTHHLF